MFELNNEAIPLPQQLLVTVREAANIQSDSVRPLGT